MAILQLKAKHFKNAVFIEPDKCPISNAAIEQFKLPSNIYVGEGVDHLTIDGSKYEHSPYYSQDYDEDMDIAVQHNFDETIIREINIPTYEPI